MSDGRSVEPGTREQMLSPGGPPGTMLAPAHTTSVTDALRLASPRHAARFHLLRAIGAGGCGVVYEAYDAEREARVALKTLAHLDADSLMRFKREFRALADVGHPNLVTLYELSSEGDEWFFTMELVEGVDFLRWVLAPGAHGPARLRGALHGLATGLVALHDAGKLHRDVKPSNAMVTPEGRVVLLDFGLVTELQGAGALRTMSRDVVGTPAYMAPEQLLGEESTPASDWYGVGVVLYEALTGELPFRGNVLELLTRKATDDAPDPRAVAPDAPEDLSELCVALLARRPDERPPGAEVLRRLGVVGVAKRRSTRRVAGSSGLIGRDAELAELNAAMTSLGAGGAQAVAVLGRSGMGKTALVRAFIERLQRHRDVVLLEGRCYQHESVPYKAVDAIVDALAHYLAALPTADAAALLPRDVHALVRLFPVLARVQAVLEAPSRGREPVDLQEARRRAFGAMRELLARLGDRRPIVVVIDDLQWGDTDSAALLAEVLRPPDAPAVLLVVSCRTENVADSALGRLLGHDGRGADREVSARTVNVGPLPDEGARALALSLLPAGAEPERERLAERIAREAGGSPFFIAELSRWTVGADADGRLDAPEHVSLDGFIQDRVARLPEDARRLLEAVAVAGVPMEESVAFRAAGLRPGELQPLVLLQREQLLAERPVRGGREVETYHDRIRESVVATIPGEALREHHRRIARALESAGHADEAMAMHFVEAGERELGARYVADAAERAAAALAFDHAARLYRVALDLASHDGARARALRVQLAHALANAGRGLDAARAYLAASGAAEGTEALDLRRRAAEQFVRCGYVAEGLAVGSEVLRALAMPPPTTRGGALASMLWRRARLRARGLGFTQRGAADVAANQLALVDTCAAVAVNLMPLDPIAATDYATRHLILALDAGEPERLARAMIPEVFYSAFQGTRTARRTARLVTFTRDVATRAGTPQALGYAELCTGGAAFLEGRFDDAIEPAGRAMALFRDHCTGRAWEVVTSELFVAWSLGLLGRIEEMTRHAEAAAADAESRGDIYATATNRFLLAYRARIAEDDPDEARRDIDRGMRGWPSEEFYFPHIHALYARAEAALYTGDARGAWETLATDWPRLERLQILRSQFLLHFHSEQRARVALALAARGEETERFLGLAEKDARRIARERTRWSLPQAELAYAGIAKLRGRTAESLEHVQRAVTGFDAAGMTLFAAAARFHHGTLRGGAEGDRERDTAQAALAAIGVRAPERYARLVAPGLGS